MKSWSTGVAYGRSRARSTGADPTEVVLARFDCDPVRDAGIARCLARHPRLVPALSRLRARIDQEFGSGAGAVLAAVEGARPGDEPVGLLVAVRVAWGGAEGMGSYQRLASWWRRHAPRAERERIALGIVPGVVPANDNAG